MDSHFKEKKLILILGHNLTKELITLIIIHAYIEMLHSLVYVVKIS